MAYSTLKWFSLTLVLFFVGYSLAQDELEEESPFSGANVVYPKETQLDLEGLQIEGELKSPGELYFQHRMKEKFDSLVKRRENFHREMLRDVVMSK